MFQVRIKELRERSGYKSQQAFADAFGVAQSTVGGWEAGKREPNFETTIKLANFFHVSVGYLLGTESEDPYSELFRTRLREELECLNTDDWSGSEEGAAQYAFISSLAESTRPLYLSEACEASDMLGRTISYMIQEIDEDADDYIRETKKSSGSEKTEPEDKMERDIIDRIRKMGPAQQSLLLATLKIADEQNQKMPVSVQGLSADKSQ